MTRPLAKSNVTAPRPTRPGPLPVSPDLQPAPRSVRAVREPDGSARDSTGEDLDRGRRLARSDPQARYGNSEVARVALRQNPPPAGVHGAAAGRSLPAAGTVAHARHGSGGGHGKPSAHPGAAKAAVDATQAGEKAKKDAAGKDARNARKAAADGARHGAKPAPGGAQAPAASGEDRRQEREDGAAGEAARGAGEDKASGGGAATGSGAASFAAPPRPFLRGTDAIALAPPPLADAQRERVRLQTGLTVAEHYARTQVALDRLASRATSEQFAIVAHLELTEAALRRDLDNAAARIAPAVDGAIERVRGACGTARAGIAAAAKDGLKIIEAHANEADRQVDATALTSKQAVDKAVVSASPRVRALHDETMAPMRAMLARQGKAFAALATLKGGGLVVSGVAAALALGKAGDPLELAQAEQRNGLAAEKMKGANEEFVAAGKRAEQDILAQEASLSLSFLMFVDPIAVKMEHLGGEDGKTVVDKGGEVRLRLASDYERAEAAVKETAARASKALDALEQSAVHQLRAMGRSLDAMARQRREPLCNAVLESRGPAAESWAQQMKGVNELVAPGGLVDWRRLEPQFNEAMAGFDALSTRQRLDFDDQARSGSDEAHAGIDGDRRSLDEAADSFVQSAQDTRRQAGAMHEIADAFGKPFQGMAAATASATLEFRTRTEEKFGRTVDDTRKQMAGLLAATEDAMQKEGLASFGKRLDDEARGILEILRMQLAAVDQAVIADLAHRAEECYAAMDGAGTDETRLFKALHGMTPVYARALAYYWTTADHAHDLWWWLDDELSGDEYSTACAYLEGDPVKGASLEIGASFHWYGDDVKQMESALRDLTPDQLKDLGKNPGFQATRQKLESSLKGTNLQVVQALLVGRTMRADALRLKEQVDAARAAGDDDKLHDLLSRVDPRALPQMRTEFLDVAAGHAMTAQPLATSNDKAVLALEGAAFAAYVTKPVQVWEPSSGRHGDGGHYRTRVLGEESSRLAVALATTGEGSADARATRLAYEVARGRKPRPEKLALALDDPELVKARNAPELRNPDVKAPEYVAARQALDRLEARRADVMTRFAALTSKDESLARDPARARAYTAQKVAGLFGDDKLGRELGTSMVADGRANPAVAIKYAVRGWGTNEELIRKTLRGMSASEIKALKTDYAVRFGDGGKDQDALFNDLGVFQNAGTAKAAGFKAASGGGFFTELSGDERQEVEELLLGTPENDRDRMRLARLKHAHQKGEGTTWATGALLAQEDGVGRDMGIPEKDRPPGAFAGRSLDMNKALMEDMVEAGGGEDRAFDEKGNFKETAKYSSNDFRLRVAATSEMAENYKHHVDSVIGMITGAIAIIGAIIGTIVVTVLTLGTATPLVIGAWAAGIAAATGAAAMATRYALKGGRYGWEEVAVDGALTLVDAATAGLTAGAGAKAARAAAAQVAAIKAVARTPAQEAVLASIIKEQGRKEVARGFVRTAAGAGVGGAARTGTADGTWDDGFLSGLGRTVHGGAEAAAIGLAAHGASHAFSTSGVGQKLGQSTSYLRRGLGTGVGGALGGMAGRGAELTLDAAQGRKLGPWDEALGSIALAGGRGFVENVGQGMAEVPHARREAGQAQREQSLKLLDDLRIARFGMSEADEHADRQFRRNALAAALRDDPRLDRRAFLGALDAGVARDRAFVEENRQLGREFRREALAAIPKERRGEFAHVAIQILPDAEFERFTGSRSGRAVTVIEDGEARIVVRRSATPETLREEGIHVLQARDPQWRERVAQLDEATLARWNELDLETQLRLYHNKVQIEIDAQQRLQADLLAEAERSVDPTRRQRLLDRAQAAGQTREALVSRRTEVGAIGAQRRAAMERGDAERPQYLREPARLFSKVATPEQEPQAPRARTLLQAREELARLRTAAGTDPAILRALEAEIGGHYVHGAGATAETLGRRQGETNRAYRSRLVSLEAEVKADATRLGRPQLHAAYERLLLSLARPIDKVRASVDELAGMASRTKAQQRRLESLLEELESHYASRPGQGMAEVEARLFARGADETDDVWRERLKGLRPEVAEHAGTAGQPGMLARLDTLARQLRRPLANVRAEIDAFERLGRPLSESEKVQLRALEGELAEHYLERPGESNVELENRLLAQNRGETLGDYLVRLKNAQEEVFTGVQQTGSERVRAHYLKLVDEVEHDVARIPALRAEIEEARRLAEGASRDQSLHRRAMLEGRGAPKNVAWRTRADVEALWKTFFEKSAELAGLASRGSARSAHYQFSDIGHVEPCFMPGTLVATPDGPRPIEALQAGDVVLARAPDGDPVPARIAGIRCSATRWVVTLGVAGESIRTTREHPFWSVTHQAWRTAQALEPGERLLARAGSVLLEARVVARELQPTLNLEIEGLHTFLVGNAGVLVHNGGESRRPDFSDLAKRPTRIYRVILIEADGSRTLIYIGKTFQGDRGNVQVRFVQHLDEKPQWARWHAQKTIDGTPRLIIEVEKTGNWTVFETAVWEEHTIRKYRNRRVDLELVKLNDVALQNRGVPITEDAFKLYRGRFRGC